MLKMKPTSFTLNHPVGISISSSLVESSLPTSDVIEKRDMKNDYIWYDVAPANIYDRLIAISLCFHNGLIDSVSIYACHEGDFTKSWGDWSETTERSNAEAVKAWLTSLGYPAGVYDWGEVWAGYDAKSASGYGGIRYNPANQ